MQRYCTMSEHISKVSQPFLACFCSFQERKKTVHTRARLRIWHCCVWFCFIRLIFSFYLLAVQSTMFTDANDRYGKQMKSENVNLLTISCVHLRLWGVSKHCSRATLTSFKHMIHSYTSSALAVLMPKPNLNSQEK